MLFSSLQRLSTDVRPEVRNSGVRTLFGCVSNLGARLPAPLWDVCMWEMLFPLLRDVYHTSATSSKEEVSRLGYPQLQL